MKYRSAWLVGVDDDISSRVKSWDITGAPEKNVKLAAWARDGWDNVEIFGASGMNRALSLSLSLSRSRCRCSVLRMFSGMVSGNVPVLFCGDNFLSQRAGLWVPRLGLCNLGKHVSVLVWDGPLQTDSSPQLVSVTYRATRRAAEGENIGNKRDYVSRWMQETTWKELPDFVSLVWRRGGLGVAV